MFGSVHVALDRPKYAHNVGAAIRAMSCFTDGGELVWTGDRVNPGEMDRIPREERMKAYADVNWTPGVSKPTELFPNHTPVAIELVEGAQDLAWFEHPENALYIFGPEDGSINAGIRNACHAFVKIPAKHCLNLSCAINVVLYDRVLKMWQEGRSDLPGLVEPRGEDASSWSPNPFDLLDA